MSEAVNLPVETFGAAVGSQEPDPDMRTLSLSVLGSPAGSHVGSSSQQTAEPVPAVVWLPRQNAGRLPLVLIGHGAGGHKAAPIVERTAARLTRLGCAALSIDCPYHGDRTPPDEVGLSAAQRRARLGLDAWRERNARATEQAVADWRAALDAAQVLDEIRPDSAGYFGLSLGARFGLPLVAAEERISAAVLGLYGYSADPGSETAAAAARRITVPVLFLLQWDDELYDRTGGLALFELLASERKVLHANPGRHLEIPPTEMAYAAAFLHEQLTV